MQAGHSRAASLLGGPVEKAYREHSDESRSLIDSSQAAGQFRV